MAPNTPTDLALDGANRSERADPIEAAVLAELRRQRATPVSPGLYLVATPIGNLGDATLRAVAILSGVDVVYCEDTRRTSKLFAHFGLRAPLQVYEEHRAERVRPRILSDLEEGRRIALVSDAGMPLVSDPGFKLVRDVISGGHAVTAIPGASAALDALCTSGLPTDAFLFAGFLPPRQAARVRRLGELSGLGVTLVFFETVHRLAAMLDDARTVLGDRPAAVARELTKRHEEHIRGSLSEIAAIVGRSHLKGELVVTIAGVGSAPSKEDATGSTDCEVSAGEEPEPSEQLDHLLRDALSEQTLRDAVASVSTRTGLARKMVYAQALRIKDTEADTT